MKSQKSNISVALAVFNEEANIARCLEAVSFADEIIIVDGESTDKTVDIARKFPHVKVIYTTNKPIFHINKQMAIDACTAPWILQLDADEVITPELAAELLDIAKKDINKVEFNGYWMPRKNYFLGSFMRKGGQYPDPTIRFYKNGFGHLPCKDVHEQAKIEGKVGWLKNDLAHYADPNFSRYLLRSNRYTTLIARELKEKNVPVNGLTFLNYYIIKPLWWFLLAFGRHRGYVDGFPGFVFALFSALRFPIAYTKYWEMTRTNQDQFINI